MNEDQREKAERALENPNETKPTPPAADSVKARADSVVKDLRPPTSGPAVRSSRE
jgi:hypothetical protein